jgi:DNA repair exonuclease SbcCD nuclease subunit
MRILRIGDPHAKVSNLDEMESLMHFVNEQILAHKVERVEILGDLFHTHAIVRLEVLEFWDAWIDVLTAHEGTDIVILVGNHDQSGDYENDQHALSVFKRIRKKNLHIVDSPRRLGLFGYLPYVHDINKWLEYARNLHADGAKALVSHTTYQGSKYESGIYAPDGVDPEQVPFDLLISGHIHSRQRFVTSRGQSVIYPGTSRWDSASDANEPKGLWLVDHCDSSARILREEFLDTSGVVTPIRSYEWREGDAQAPEFDARSKSHVQLIGSSAFIAQAKAQLKGSCTVSTKITDRSRPANRVAQANLGKFLETCTLGPNVQREELQKFMKELGLV